MVKHTTTYAHSYYLPNAHGADSCLNSDDTDPPSLERSEKLRTPDLAEARRRAKATAERIGRRVYLNARTWRGRNYPCPTQTIEIIHPNGRTEEWPPA